MNLTQAPKQTISPTGGTLTVSGAGVLINSLTANLLNDEFCNPTSKCSAGGTFNSGDSLGNVALTVNLQ